MKSWLRIQLIAICLGFAACAPTFQSHVEDQEYDSAMNFVEADNDHHRLLAKTFLEGTKLTVEAVPIPPAELSDEPIDADVWVVNLRMKHDPKIREPGWFFLAEGRKSMPTASRKHFAELTDEYIPSRRSYYKSDTGGGILSATMAVLTLGIIRIKPGKPKRVTTSSDLPKPVRADALEDKYANYDDDSVRSYVVAVPKEGDPIKTTIELHYYSDLDRDTRRMTIMQAKWNLTIHPGEDLAKTMAELNKDGTFADPKTLQEITWIETSYPQGERIILTCDSPQTCLP